MKRVIGTAVVVILMTSSALLNPTIPTSVRGTSRHRCTRMRGTALTTPLPALTTASSCGCTDRRP